MSPDLLEAAITPRTKAILPVHLYGQMADMEPILAVAQRHGVPVVEDACQAHGAEFLGKRAGSFGIAGCFSFYPGKNLGACGEGGAVTTNDPDLARRLRMWREHGSVRKYEHEFPGLNMRLEGLQGAILACKLKSLDRWNNQRREAARIYSEVLDSSVVQIPREMEYGKHVFHLYVVQVDDRDAMRTQLASVGVETGLHYPIPLHMQQAYKHLGYQPGDFPVTERTVERIVSLPMYPGITEEALKHVAEVVQESCRVA
jgi:dTDP-4-amino-4,6-dideoxygalactose transaminase